MDRSKIAAIIIGMMFVATGGFMLGRWDEPAGIFFILMGCAMVLSPVKPSTEKPEKTWIGD